MHSDVLPVIVFSHLRWDFVYQRPQHLLSRLARNRRVIFIEEPVHDAEAAPHWEHSKPLPNLLVCKPLTPVQDQGYSREQMPYLTALVQQLVAEERLEEYIIWMYTPMALPLAQELTPRSVVFDVMDELSAFKFAPAELVEREESLMRWADVVFTGGPSLYKAKQHRHSNIHCFPSSVDAGHFRQALTAEDAQDQADIPHPRFGFYGVIDERMDLDLLDAIATTHPEWHIVMVGPVVKISPDDLPRHPNVHYMGQRTYNELPSYLVGWDVCLLPFARNESTRFISPTKTVEYMAAEKPIVSTPITDVAEPYGDIVYLGDTPQEFIAACEQALHASAEEREARLAKMHRVLEKTSWDTTVEAMEKLINQVVEGNADLNGEHGAPRSNLLMQTK
ncbi:MAG TPA: glycosyltransferase family 1 protein [Chloroflexia bacterium]|nr:glycosyltransferase family 1 protein [Chloroflexia bacterium]